MSNFFAELGRTRVFAEAYTIVRSRRKPAENDAHRKKGLSGWKLINQSTVPSQRENPRIIGSTTRHFQNALTLALQSLKTGLQFCCIFFAIKNEEKLNESSL